MLALAPIVAQLKAAGFRQVEGVLEFSAQTEAPRSLPALFVVPIADDARPNELAGRRDQKVTAGWSVMAVVEGARRQGDGVSDELKKVTDRVGDALTGWTHPEASGPTDYAGGRLASADGSAVVWEVRFRTSYHLRKAS